MFLGFVVNVILGASLIGYTKYMKTEREASRHTDATSQTS